MNSSTDAGRPGRVTVGRIGRPHGLRGEVTVLPDSDDPARFAVGSTMLTDRGQSLVVATVSQYRDRGLIVRFEGVGDRDQAEVLRGSILTVASDDRRPLGEDEFWPDDLVGLTAVSPDGRVLGIVSAVDLGVGQHRIVVVTPDGEDVLVPFVDDLVGDPADGRIEIHRPGGLFHP